LTQRAQMQPAAMFRKGSVALMTHIVYVLHSDQ